MRYTARLKLLSKYLIGFAFALAGLNHFLNPDLYLRMMPRYLPWHLFLVYLSGFFEVALGLLLFVSRYRRIAAWGLIALLVAVFPANVHMALNPQLFPAIPPFALWLRLPLQALLIAWVYSLTKGEARG
ncbi:MAG TPA: MauE/DoxX family redox-associated membrane protein [Pyrinomonadaceae bacterium]|nr:MauE/DoxX family redox-associated membrane protein [Pyrinomonadaceae bacterium]